MNEKLPKQDPNEALRQAETELRLLQATNKARAKKNEADRKEITAMEAHNARERQTVERLKVRNERRRQLERRINLAVRESNGNLPLGQRISFLAEIILEHIKP